MHFVLKYRAIWGRVLSQAISSFKLGYEIGLFNSNAIKPDCCTTSKVLPQVVVLLRPMVTLQGEPARLCVPGSTKGDMNEWNWAMSFFRLEPECWDCLWRRAPCAEVGFNYPPSVTDALSLGLKVDCILKSPGQPLNWLVFPQYFFTFFYLQIFTSLSFVVLALDIFENLSLIDYFNPFTFIVDFKSCFILFFPIIDPSLFLVYCFSCKDLFSRDF